MDWRDSLKETVGVIDEKNIVDLTDMEGRELLGKEHLNYAVFDRRSKRTDSNIIKSDSHV